MNQVATRPAVAPARPEPPRFSGYLQQAIQAVQSAHPDVGSPLAGMPVAVRDEADRALRRLDAFLAPPTLDEWISFLRPLAVLAKAPQSQPGIIAYAKALTFALNDVPAALLTPDRQRDLIRRGWWPRHDEILEVMQPHMQPLRMTRAALVQILSTKPTARAVQRLPDDVREKISAGLKDLAAELASRSAPATQGEGRRTRASHISQGATLAMLEALAEQGDQAAATRAAALRARLAADADR